MDDVEVVGYLQDESGDEPLRGVAVRLADLVDTAAHAGVQGQGDMLQFHVAVRGFAERTDDGCGVVDCSQAVAPHVTDQHSYRAVDTFGGVHVSADVCVGGGRAIGSGDFQTCHTTGQTEAPPAHAKGFTTPPARTEGALDR